MGCSQSWPFHGRACPRRAGGSLSLHSDTTGDINKDRRLQRQILPRRSTAVELCPPAQAPAPVRAIEPELSATPSLMITGEVSLPWPTIGFQCRSFCQHLIQCTSRYYHRHEDLADHRFECSRCNVHEAPQALHLSLGCQPPPQETRRVRELPAVEGSPLRTTLHALEAESTVCPSAPQVPTWLYNCDFCAAAGVVNSATDYCNMCYAGYCTGHGG